MKKKYHNENHPKKRTHSVVCDSPRLTSKTDSPNHTPLADSVDSGNSSEVIENTKTFANFATMLRKQKELAQSEAFPPTTESTNSNNNITISESSQKYQVFSSFADMLMKKNEVSENKATQKNTNHTEPSPPTYASMLAKNSEKTQPTDVKVSRDNSEPSPPTYASMLAKNSEKTQPTDVKVSHDNSDPSPPTYASMLAKKPEKTQPTNVKVSHDNTNNSKTNTPPTTKRLPLKIIPKTSTKINIHVPIMKILRTGKIERWLDDIVYFSDVFDRYDISDHYLWNNCREPINGNNFYHYYSPNDTDVKASNIGLINEINGLINKDMILLKQEPTLYILNYFIERYSSGNDLENIDNTIEIDRDVKDILIAPNTNRYHVNYLLKLIIDNVFKNNYSYDLCHPYEKNKPEDNKNYPLIDVKIKDKFYDFCFQNSIKNTGFI